MKEKIYYNIHLLLFSKYYKFCLIILSVLFSLLLNQHTCLLLEENSNFLLNSETGNDTFTSYCYFVLSICAVLAIQQAFDCMPIDGFVLSDLNLLLNSTDILPYFDMCDDDVVEIINSKTGNIILTMSAEDFYNKNKTPHNLGKHLSKEVIRKAYFVLLDAARNGKDK